MITAEQKAYFHTFGFIHLPKQFSAEEMKAVTDEADRLWEEHRKGRPLGEDQGVQEFVEKGPVMTQMVADDRIWGTVEALLGPQFVWNGSEGNLDFDDSDHRWHTDRQGEPHATTYSFHLYLDPLRADTGCLRLIPGSHRSPLHDDLLSINEQAADSTMKVFGLSPTDVPGVAVESEPGDIVFFSQKIYHGVYGKLLGRRFLKLRFVAWPETDEQIASLMRYNNRGRIYRPDDAFANSDNPRIRAMVDPLLELADRTEAEREHFDALGARDKVAKY